MKRIVTLGAEVHMAYQTSLGFVIGCHIGCSLGSPVVVGDEQQYTLIKKYDIESLLIADDVND